MALPTPLRVQRSVRILGSHISATRKLQRLTAAQLAERAGISVVTLRRLEKGDGSDGSVSLETFLRVVRSLGLLDTLEAAVDPYNTDVGRLRADEQLPDRVRHRKED
ncbi:MAG: helix-turn-helix domain protein [Subtercola sp.]|nr:helix-turn-helix domain protein [Subtercola sp.]